MPDKELEKVYDPKKVEEKWTKRWEKDAISHADSQSEKPSFSIVIPPPNVTGSLHLGHALNSTLQDILSRWHRMRGDNVLWLPGMDHAGIATQNVVERQLAAEGGKDRHALGREAFIERVWDWKEESGGTILNQLKRLGASCDWERERFTMDEGLSRAVTTVFEQLYKEGLIYRDQRLINLCPHCRTALSDIEVEHEDIEGKMYYIKYPLADDPTQFLTIATTRPETMLGDTAVAVHPKDPRFNHLIGKKIKLPLTTREIPIIGDPILVDREKGTGAVKITPGHDFNDEKSGKRHQLEKISLITWSGKMNAAALDEAKVASDLSKLLSSKSMTEARKIVVKVLEDAAILTKTEKHMMSLGKCYRCKSVVEPFDSPQWFVKVNAPDNSLAQAAMDAVRQKKIRLIPESWEANYFGWMENIEDWCISRQIWWGHQVPVFYCKTCDQQHLLKVPDSDEMIIASEATPIVGEKTCARCGGSDLLQDPDVLDTWFSSALWPFSTLGWPTDQQPDEAAKQEAKALLKRFYPTSTLVSGFDILFFWVARMIMMGLHFMKDVPFKDVYIHALVRDANGQKMSKSKGNVINPLDLMDQYGTDALRFTLAAMASPGRDIKLSEARIEGYRNFCNKLWNVARFILMNRPETETSSTLDPQTAANRWIQSHLNQTIVSTNRALENYRFDEAAQEIYQFSWHTFCDWYLELAKVDLQNEATRHETYHCVVQTFESILRLLHPFMPFLTEELRTYFKEDTDCLAVSKYPVFDPEKNAVDAEEAIQKVVIDTIMAVRNIRGEMNIPPSESLPILIKAKDQAAVGAFEKEMPYIKRLARLSEVTLDTTLQKPEMSATATTAYGTIYLPLDEQRIRSEIDRIKKRLDKAQKALSVFEKKLGNEKFVANAPAEVVEKTKTEQQAGIQNKERLFSELQHLENFFSKPKETP
ncbi:Valyl-tRNA synthetase [hydrothermal vent metagenome]|uniref:valine--tRNA ligase n=1 Tax=hydrothermal vent metagenome TaxID=652676 RepID=A0A3B1D3G3_9ZZZZ